MAAATEANEGGVQVKASAKYARVSPQKARLVADQVRGLGVDEALSILAFSTRGAAENVRKLIDSAAANAENNFDLDPEEMVVAAINIDEGPTLKRWRARARGRASRIEKRTCHMSVVLRPEVSE